MHDLEYAYVNIGVLVWTPQLIEQMKKEMDHGIEILSARRWVFENGEGHWKEIDNG